MEHPHKEIADVVRSISEPKDSTVILSNVDKYFTADAMIQHPILNQLYSRNGRDDLKGVYKMLRVLSINNKIEFYAIMFNQDFTQGTLEFTQHMQPRFLPFKFLTVHIRYLTRIDLRKEYDDKYRIYRQQDNFPTDISYSGLPVFPGVTLINDIVKAIAGIITIIMGRFFISTGWFGP